LVGEFHLNSKSPIAVKNGEKQKFTTTKIPPLALGEVLFKQPAIHLFHFNFIYFVGGMAFQPCELNISFSQFSNFNYD
jgi:hypothetical protein